MSDDVPCSKCTAPVHYLKREGDSKEDGYCLECWDVHIDEMRLSPLPTENLKQIRRSRLFGDGYLSILNEIAIAEKEGIETDALWKEHSKRGNALSAFIKEDQDRRGPKFK
jgi:hypothetical protein